MVLARCMRSAARLTRQSWDKTQVELQGSFSRDHVKHFEEYVARTSTMKALLICLWTPVPVVFLAVLIEAIPTADPATHTARQSPFVWLRIFVMSLICSVCYLEQFRQHLPTLRLPRRHLWIVSIVSTAVSAGFQFAIADQIAYPFPFSVVMASFVWAPALSSMFLFAIRTQLREEPQLVSDLRRHLAVCVCQFVLIGVYPAFNAVFVSVSEWKQTTMVFVLPVIKLAAKNWIGRWIANAEEARAEAVIFNVDVFHALYVSFSMQNSTAIHTVAAIMALDFIQAWLSFADMTAAMIKVAPLTEKLTNHLAQAQAQVSPPNSASASLLTTKPSVRLAPTGRQHSQLRLVLASSSIHPLDDAKAVSGAMILPKLDETRTEQNDPKWLSSVFNREEQVVLTQETQKLLFISQFIALIEYTEVMMPFVFSMYMVVMFHFPNRKYHNFLRGLTVEKLLSKITNVFLYASLELVSLVVMASILWHKLRISMLHQIAFVLEHRQISIQVKVIMWALFVMQTDTQQSGVDYSFKFAWLKG